MLGLLLPGHGVANAHGLTARTSAGPTFLTANTKAHTATLVLTASLTTALGGFNFDGYGQGKMVVTIPVGYKVTATFTNKGALPHSAIITLASQKAMTNAKPAFLGAETPNPVTGSPPGATMKFTFTASKAGSYAIVCAVPGHEAAGMWDTLKVAMGAKPSVTFLK
ncbi:MAG: hypothetical protein JWO42_2988 [Chloroflexi bacterium]|nr:hypothetical protein [Chloroflexota bacterium]